MLKRIGQAGMQPNLDGSVLLLAAALEQFVTDIIVEFTEALPGIVPIYSDLPKATRSANERFTGQALSNRRNRFAEYDLRRFVHDLSKCQAGIQPYALNGEAIALNDRNLRVGTLKDLIGRLGVHDIWPVIASTPNLRRWSGPGGANVAEARAKNQLNELNNYRNRIAHSVGSVAPGPETIRSYIRFGRALARSVVRGLDQHASTL